MWEVNFPATLWNCLCNLLLKIGYKLNVSISSGYWRLYVAHTLETMVDDTRCDFFNHLTQQTINMRRDTMRTHRWRTSHHIAAGTLGAFHWGYHHAVTQTWQLQSVGANQYLLHQYDNQAVIQKQQQAGKKQHNTSKRLLNAWPTFWHCLKGSGEGHVRFPNDMPQSPPCISHQWNSVRRMQGSPSSCIPAVPVMWRNAYATIGITRLKCLYHFHESGARLCKLFDSQCVKHADTDTTTSLLTCCRTSSSLTIPPRPTCQMTYTVESTAEDRAEECVPEGMADASVLPLDIQGALNVPCWGMKALCISLQASGERMASDHPSLIMGHPWPPADGVWHSSAEPQHTLLAILIGQLISMLCGLIKMVLVHSSTEVPKVTLASTTWFKLVWRVHVLLIHMGGVGDRVVRCQSATHNLLARINPDDISPWPPSLLTTIREETVLFVDTSVCGSRLVRCQSAA